MRKIKEYALYKGDKFLMIGTINEIAKAYNVKPNTVRYYGNPSYKKRRENGEDYLLLIEIEED